MTHQIVTVVPSAPAEDTGLTLTQGTKVLGADGQPIQGITKIELVANVNDVWRAVVHCHAQVGELAGVAAELVETTNLDSVAREFRLKELQADPIPDLVEAIRELTTVVKGLTGVLIEDREQEQQISAAVEGDANPEQAAEGHRYMDQQRP